MAKDNKAEMAGAFVDGYCATPESIAKGNCVVFTRNEESIRAGSAFLHFWQFQDGRPTAFGEIPLRSALAGLVGFCWRDEFWVSANATTCADQALEETAVKEMKEQE